VLALLPLVLVVLVVVVVPSFLRIVVVVTADTKADPSLEDELNLFSCLLIEAADSGGAFLSLALFLVSELA
jgi:hypothetical protein